MYKKQSMKWHSYLGVAIGFFIFIAALSGSCIAFYHALDESINPWQVSFAPSKEAPILDPLAYVETIEANISNGNIRWISLSLSHQSSFVYFLWPQNIKKPLENNQVFVDPYSGKIKGMRFWGDITQGWINLLPFIYKLHYSLSLGSIGELIMGIVAFLWVIVIICGVVITLPKGNKAFFAKWKKSWQWHFKGNLRAKSYHLHKTLGLWILPLLFLIAWSSFALNMHELHEKLLGSVMHFQTEKEQIKDLKRPRQKPKIGWIQAREKGQSLMKELSLKEGFDIYEESSIMYNDLKGIYIYSVRSSRDIEKDHGSTSVFFDGNSGVMKASFIPSGKANGDTVSEWLTGLHKGSIWGFPHRVVLAILGMAVLFFTLSGYYLWWKKKQKLDLNQ